MATQLTSKQPAEAYAVSFDFTAYLGAETVATATITATDTATLADVSTTILDVAQQSIATPIVYAWVRAGTSGHNYLITCRIVGNLGSIYELDGILPVLEDQGPASSSAGGLVVGPAIEPVSLQDMREHLRLDSGSFFSNLSPIQSIVPGSHATTTLYGLLGAYADVLGYSAVVILDSGTNAATGTVDVKIQESDDHVTWNDWTGGAFTQVMTANDNAIQKIAYTGAKQYIRVVAKVLLAACEFGVSVAKYSSDATEDTILAALITAARQQVEAITQRQLITATFDAFFDEFPAKGFIPLPFGQLQSVTSLTYTDSDGTPHTMTPTTDYLVDASSDPGRVYLPYGGSWPSFTAHPVNPIAIRFVAGFGSNASDVPAAIRTAIKMLAEDYWNNRSATHTQAAGNVTENKAVMALLYPFRLWSF